MTPQEFENLLIRTKAQLIEAFQHGSVSNDDVTTKAILDYQQQIANALFEEIARTRAILIKDNFDRFQMVTKKIDDNHKEMLKKIDEK